MKCKVEGCKFKCNAAYAMKLHKGFVHPELATPPKVNIVDKD